MRQWDIEGLGGLWGNDADVAYIAAASPDVILALLDVILEAGDYGLGRDGCPFCGGVAFHIVECAALEAGSTQDRGMWEQAQRRPARLR